MFYYFVLISFLECYERPLGAENGELLDAQFKASSEKNKYVQA